MKEYPTKAIADLTGLSAQKVRSYAQALEKAGHNITRNDRGFRMFTEDDIPLFQEMIKQSNEAGMSVEEIALQLVASHNNDTSPEIELNPEADTPMQHEVEMRDLPVSEEDRYQILLEEINSLKQLIADQQKHIEECIEQQRDLKSLELLRESQEFKKQILEIAASQEQEKKKGFFSRLFKL
jgi:DNA-binding transcriptional MerR regulator